MHQSRSQLSWKVLLADVITQLNDNGCISVTRLLQDALGYNDLNSFVIVVMMKLSSKITQQSLITINDQIQQILNDPNMNIRKQQSSTTKTTNTTRDTN